MFIDSWGISVIFCQCKMPSFNHKSSLNDFVFPTEWKHLIGPFGKLEYSFIIARRRREMILLVDLKGKATGMFIDVGGRGYLLLDISSNGK